MRPRGLLARYGLQSFKWGSQQVWSLMGRFGRRPVCVLAPHLPATVRRSGGAAGLGDNRNLESSRVLHECPDHVPGLSSFMSVPLLPKTRAMSGVKLFPVMGVALVVAFSGCGDNGGKGSQDASGDIGNGAKQSPPEPVEVTRKHMRDVHRDRRVRRPGERLGQAARGAVAGGSPAVLAPRSASR